MANRVFVSLGSNIDKERNLPAAVRILNRLCNVVAISSVYETVPVGLEDQPRFWNAAAIVETGFDAFSFRRQVLTRVERHLKRVRTNEPNAPRTIDADMILFNSECFDLDEAHPIPDPDLLKYPHVAVPMADLDPNYCHPVTGEALRQIATRLLESGTHSDSDELPIRVRSDIDLRPLIAG